MKRILIAALGLILILSTVAGCGSSASSKAAEMDELQAQIDEKFEQIDTIMEEHGDLWEKLYEQEGDALNDVDDGITSIYTGYMSSLLEKYGDLITDEERKMLTEDVEKIRQLEKELVPLQEEYDKCRDAAGVNEEKPMPEMFPEFKGEDLNGNPVDSSMFKDNTATVVNFWYNTCSPCIGELDNLNELNTELKKEGGSVIGINTDTLDGSEEMIKEAKKILKEKGASYQNIRFDTDSEAGKMASGILGFPTTLVVDSKGKIVGEPILGGIEDPETLKLLQSQIDQAITGEK